MTCFSFSLCLKRSRVLKGALVRFMVDHLFLEQRCAVAAWRGDEHAAPVGAAARHVQLLVSTVRASWLRNSDCNFK